MSMAKRGVPTVSRTESINAGSAGLGLKMAADSFACLFALRTPASSNSYVLPETREAGELTKPRQKWGRQELSLIPSGPRGPISDAKLEKTA